MSTPIERLRALHKPCEPCIYTNHWFARTAGTHCQECLDTWPCDTIAALDALEAGLHSLLDARPTRGQLKARLDAATELIRQAMEERHYSIRPNTGDSETRCGSPIGTSIDTCENCRPYREWLGKGEGQ